MHSHSFCFLLRFVFLILPSAHAQDLQGKLDRQMCVYEQLHGAGNLVLKELKEQRIDTLSIHALQDQVIRVCFLSICVLLVQIAWGLLYAPFEAHAACFYAVTINAFDVSLLVFLQAARSQQGLEALYDLNHDDLLIFSGVDACTHSLRLSSVLPACRTRCLKRSVCSFLYFLRRLGLGELSAARSWVAHQPWHACLLFPPACSEHSHRA